jgi:hypothetical protein
MDWPFALLHGGLCLCAVFFAAHARDNRSGAIGLACVMTAGWALYVSAWTPANPGAALGIANKDLWAISDALFGAAAIGLAWAVWWGWAFWMAALTATGAHLAYKFWGHDFEAYSTLLDNLLRAQIALFFMIGGRGVADRVLRGCRRLRDAWRAAYPAFSRSRTR